MFETELPEPDLGSLDSDELLAEMAAAQRVMNRAAALQLAYAAEFAHRRPAPELPAEPGAERERWAGVSEFAGAEIGCALTISRRAADRLVGTALGLERLPAIRAVFTAGGLDLPRVRLVCEETAHLDDPDAAAVEARVAGRASGQVFAELRRRLRQAMVTLAPAAEQDRQERIVDQRRTWLEHDGDGRSRHIAEGPTHEVFRIAAAIDAVARTLDPQVGLEQRRFDGLTQTADTILDDPGLPGTRFGRPGLVLLAPPATLARLRGEQPGAAGGDGDRPVELAGVGPIPDSLAVELLEHRHTVLVPLDPTQALACDHTLGYEVPDRLARSLAGLYPRCGFPGCGTPVHRCDWDHMIPWPDGPTCGCNLIPLCRHHHRLKTHTRWQIRLHEDRQVHWTSPTGRSYTVHPDVDIGDGAIP